MSSVGSFGGGWVVKGQQDKPHDPQFYRDFMDRRDEAIAQGKDPYHQYKETVAARKSDSFLKRMVDSVRNDKKDKRVSSDEVKEAASKS